MKCLFCDADIVGNYCSNCGKKAIQGFSISNFREVQKQVLKNPREWVSKEFKEATQSGQLGSVGIMTTQEMFKQLQRCGYLFRVIEEKFGDIPKIRDEQFLKVLAGKKTLPNRLQEATDYLDGQLTTISISDLDEKYLIVKEIVPVFEDYIAAVIEDFVERARTDKLGGVTLKKDLDLSTINEILFRNATWGYLYRIVEEQV
jgi:hypothetical protein